MKKIIKKFFIFTVMTVMCVFSLSANGKTVDVMFVHDVHSYLDRISQAKTLIDEQKAKNPDTMILDAGDFSQGTLYQTVFSTKAAELRTLGAIGVDVTTLGNHEFDCGSLGLADMLNAARSSGDKLPEMVLCNVDWSKTDEYTMTVKPAFQNYGVKDYVILQKGDVKIAVFGIFGENALFCAPTCKLTFLNQYETAAKIVAQIKEKENPDMIVCVSHSGTNKKASKSEDEILAKKVPDIDLIISGHSHTKLDQPIQHGNTYVVSSKAYCKFVGSMGLSQMENGRWQVSRYEMLPVDDSVADNKGIRAKLINFGKDIDTEYLAKFALSSTKELAKAEDTYTHSEMGHVVTDMYRIAVKKYEQPTENAENMGYGKHIDMAVLPTGVLRGEFKQGKVTTQNVFDCFSLGIGPDRITGYPLVSVYLTGKEIKNACEIDCSVARAAGMQLLTLYFSGVTYEYNPHRMLLDKVTKAYIINDDGSKTEVKDNQLYRVVSDIYTGNMLGSVNDLTHGLLSLIPKNSDGSVIEDIEDNIIRVNIYPGVNEFKGWAAIAEGIQMEKVIPDYAEIDEAAFTAVPSRNIFKIMAHPSKFASIVYGIIFGSIILIAGIVVLCLWLKKWRKK